MNPSAEAFLKTIQSRASVCAGLFINGKPTRLWAKFWSYSEIQAGLALRQDWEVSRDHVPFYGDWHEILCLSLATGQVLYLDDERSTICTWPNTEAFINNLILTLPPEPEEPQPKVIGGWISHELKAKTEAFLRGKGKA